MMNCFIALLLPVSILTIVFHSNTLWSQER
jgi:hypothetical protein